MKELMIVPKEACNNAKNAASQLFATKGDVTPAMYYNEMVDRVGKPIKGMEISVDVSTGDEDYDHRLHLTLTGECEDGTFYAYMSDNYRRLDINRWEDGQRALGKVGDTWHILTKMQITDDMVSYSDDENRINIDYHPEEWMPLPLSPEECEE